MAKLKQTSLLAFAKVSEDKHEDCNELSPENSAVEGEQGEEANAELIVSDQGAAAVTDDGEHICTADCCCIARKNPNQRFSKEILLCTKRIQGHGKNQQCRYIQASWFKQHTWLTFSTMRRRKTYSQA